MNDRLVTVGDRLRWAFEQERQLRRTTQEAFARSIGISSQALGQIFSGETKSPRPQRLFEIQRLYGYSAEWLATGEGPRRTQVTAQAKEPLALYSMTPDVQSRLLSVFDRLTIEQQEHYLAEIEAAAHANEVIVREVGARFRAVPDDRVGHHIPPAPKLPPPKTRA